MMDVKGGHPPFEMKFVIIHTYQNWVALIDP